MTSAVMQEFQTLCNTKQFLGTAFTPRQQGAGEHLLGEPIAGPYVVMGQSILNSARLKDPASGKWVDGGAHIPLKRILALFLSIATEMMLLLTPHFDLLLKTLQGMETCRRPLASQQRWRRRRLQRPYTLQVRVREWLWRPQRRILLLHQLAATTPQLRRL